MQQKNGCHKYVISVGSNSVNDRAVRYIMAAFDFLAKKFEVIAVSSIIPTRAIDTKVDCQFFNAVVSLQTFTFPAQLKLLLKEIEIEMGRIPHSEEVVIDLDIILVDGVVVHEDYENRAFIRELIQTIDA